jgi:3'-phosphoadenosine 5'-phosphosulfate sulfotransferase (PAPS reductase)/FAD synthetase
MHMLEEKENKSRQIVMDALKDVKNPFVIFDGSLRSLVLLHLTRQISVLCIDRNIESEKINQYIEKMRKLWKLRLIRENIGLEEIIKKYDIDKLFSYDEINIELSKIIYPIHHFDDNDVWNYIKKYNLPYCSIYDKQDIVDPEKEEEIKKRLGQLGYL